MRDGADRLVADIAMGAIAGAVGTWAMGMATTYLYEHEDEEARRAEDDARGGRTAYGVAVEKVAGAAGRHLPAEQRQKLGSQLHWALGIGAGAAYGALRGRLPGIDASRGAVFGAAFFLVVDEGANTMLGLTPAPTAFPWQTHARGLAGHLVFGVVTEAVLDAADSVFREAHPRH